MRIEHGDMSATIDYVEEWTYQLDIIQERVHYKKSILTDFVLPSKFIYYGKKLILDFL